MKGSLLTWRVQTETALNFLVLQLQEESDKEDTSDKILGLLSTGIAKLLISGMITDERARLRLFEAVFLLNGTLGHQDLVDGVFLSLQRRKSGVETMCLIFHTDLLALVSEEPEAHARGSVFRCRRYDFLSTSFVTDLYPYIPEGCETARGPPG
jgi:hypothetical protein